LIGHDIILDDAQCLLHGKVFTLPTYLEVFSTQGISRQGSVFRAFLSFRKSTIKAFKRFLGLPQMTGIFNGLPIRIGIEVGQTHIQPDSFTHWFSLLDPLNIKTKLKVVPVCTTNNPNPFNQIQLVFVQISGSPQLETSGFKPIGGNDGSSILRQLRATGFVFYRTMCLMLFKAWETNIRCFLLTVVRTER
jgi:hypothetical protein